MRPETYQQMVNSSACSAADTLEVFSVVPVDFWISQGQILYYDVAFNPRSDAVTKAWLAANGDTVRRRKLH